MGKCRKMTWLVCVGLLLSVGAAATQAGLQDGLASHFKLDETSGTIAADSSGHGNDGTLYGQGLDGRRGFGGGSSRDRRGQCRREFPTAGMSASAGTFSLCAYLNDPQPAQTRYFFGHTARPPTHTNRIQIYMNSASTHCRSASAIPTPNGRDPRLATKAWYTSY